MLGTAGYAALHDGIKPSQRQMTRHLNVLTGAEIVQARHLRMRTDSQWMPAGRQLPGEQSEDKDVGARIGRLARKHFGRYVTGVPATTPAWVNTVAVGDSLPATVRASPKSRTLI